MARRCILLLLCAAMLCALPGCAMEERGEEPMRVLIIGNSHSVDAFYMLQEVFAEQMPEGETNRARTPGVSLPQSLLRRASSLVRGSL